MGTAVWVVLLVMTMLYVASFTIPYNVARRKGLLPAAAVVGAWFCLWWAGLMVTSYNASDALGISLIPLTAPWAVAAAVGLTVRWRDGRKTVRIDLSSKE